MCWLSKKSIQPIIATEDISVIKVLSKHIRLYKEVLISPYYGMEYKLDEIYETDIKVEHGDCITSISEGFHSYSLKCPLKKTSNALIVWTKDCTNVITGYIDNVTPDSFSNEPETSSVKDDPFADFGSSIEINDDELPF